MALNSAGAKEKAIAQHSSDPFLVLLTITHDDIAPIYVVRNNKAIVSRGNTYLAYPFEIDLPTDTDQSPGARISIANVSRRIGKAIESLITAPTVKIEIVLASALDSVERTWDEFTLTQVSYDAMTVTATLAHISYWNEGWPKKIIRPALYPGLFA